MTMYHGSIHRFDEFAKLPCFTDDHGNMEVTIMATIFRVRGWTEDVTSCQCCGREDLKGTVVLEHVETGEIFYYGCVCAGRALGWSAAEARRRLEREARDQLRQLKEQARRELLVHPLYQQAQQVRARARAEAKALGLRPGKEFAQHMKAAGYQELERQAREEVLAKYRRFGITYIAV